MKIGLIASSRPNRERSLQSKDLYRYLRPDKTLVKGDDMDFSLRYFRNKSKIKSEFTKEDIDWLTEDMDIVIAIDDDYCGGLLYKVAKRKGVKSVLMYNFDQLEQAINPELALPDMFLACSKWHFDDVKKAFGNIARVEYIPFPVSRDIPFTRRKKARNFVHITGDDFLDDENGTEIFIQALFSVQEDINIRIFAQRDLVGQVLPSEDGETLAHSLQISRKPLNDLEFLFKNMDVLVLPRRFGGLSMIANMAMSVGVIPMMPNVEPQNDYLNPLMLTPIRGIHMAQRKTAFEKFDVDPITVAMHMDHLSKTSHAVIGELSDYCDVFATAISWQNLLPRYMRMFESLLKK